MKKKLAHRLCVVTPVKMFNAGQYMPVAERNEGSVAWTLRHSHLNWDYGLEFCFDRKAYDYEMYGLKCYIKRIEEDDGNKFLTDERKVERKKLYYG